MKTKLHLRFIVLDQGTARLRTDGNRKSSRSVTQKLNSWAESLKGVNFYPTNFS